MTNSIFSDCEVYEILRFHTDILLLYVCRLNYTFLNKKTNIVSRVNIEFKMINGPIVIRLQSKICFNGVFTSCNITTLRYP